MQENELFTVWVRLLIICLYPADYVRVSSARPFALVISSLHHFEHLALKSPERTEQVGSSLFTWSIRVSTVVQKLVLILTRWSVETSTEAFFILHTNFSYQIVTLRTEIVSSNERNMFLIIDTYASISLTNRIVWSYQIITFNF